MIIFRDAHTVFLNRFGDDGGESGGAEDSKRIWGVFFLKSVFWIVFLFLTRTQIFVLWISELLYK